MKIDSHQHFWKYNESEYDWIDDSMAVLRKDFLPADLWKELRNNGIDCSVAVQARQTVEETRWLLQLAMENDFVKGVVGWVDMRRIDVEDELENLALNRKLKGLRHVLQDEADDRFMLREDFLRGISKLKKFGLTYDILIFPKHIKYATEMVNKFSTQPFVVDHIAKPVIREGKIEPWRTDLQELALRPNVYCKLSGMVTEARWHNWEKDDFTACMEAVLEAFGPGRIMFGSDWPVCTVAAKYEQVLGIVTDFIRELSETEQAKIMGENAIEFYNLAV